jgi:hypothetical protein
MAVTRFSVGVRWMGIGLLLGGGAWAAEPEAVPAPDLALLEYLGELVDDDGQWVGPEDMAAARTVRVTMDDEPATTQVVR